MNSLVTHQIITLIRTLLSNICLSFAFHSPHYIVLRKVAQWLSGIVLDSRPRGRGFEPHQYHCIVVLEQDLFILV